MTALTPRQREVCDLLVMGLCNKQIAHDLGISHRTVEDHRTTIFEKLEVRNVVELIRKVYRLDQLQPERGLYEQAEELADA